MNPLELGYSELPQKLVLEILVIFYLYATSIINLTFPPNPSFFICKVGMIIINNNAKAPLPSISGDKMV